MKEKKILTSTFHLKTRRELSLLIEQQASQIKREEANRKRRFHCLNHPGSGEYEMGGGGEAKPSGTKGPKEPRGRHGKEN